MTYVNIVIRCLSVGLSDAVSVLSARRLVGTGLASVTRVHAELVFKDRCHSTGFCCNGGHRCVPRQAFVDTRSNIITNTQATACQ